MPPTPPCSSARDVGLTGHDLPAQLEARLDVLALLDAIRVQASVRMGIARNVDAARRITIVPFVAIVAPPSDSLTLSGDVVRGSEIDLVARVISNGQPHRALPLTVSLCTAVAAQMTSTVAAEALSSGTLDGPLRLGMPSGLLTVGADIRQDAGAWVVRAGSFYRTARRLFAGQAYIPARNA
jgi:2-methylaconitate isomerase